ncbi:MAG: transcriptional regulator GlxA family with amidase domain [Hyphomicrobiaceae bacterium]
MQSACPIRRNESWESMPLAHTSSPRLQPLPFRPQDEPCRIGFFLVPSFSMIAFASALEPLRAANHCAESVLFSWYLHSIDGQPVTASNGIEISVDGSFRDANKLAAFIVCAGVNVQNFDHSDLIATMRRISSSGSGVGAVCTGSYVLAKAGLLDNHRCTIHWDNLASMVANFPNLEVSEKLFEIDRNRFTCAGGTASIDMMLSIIASDYNEELAAHIADLLIHHRIREGSERQRMDLRNRLGVTHPKLLAVIRIMEETIESPVTCPELARQASVSSRQLERLFSKYLGHSPTRHYLIVRLERARFMLLQTSMPILSVATACGFVSASHFSKSYSDHFRCTPSAERRERTPGASDSSHGPTARMARRSKPEAQSR